MRDVTPGEPILQHMTAKWFNSTLKHPSKTGLSPEGLRPDPNIILGYYESSDPIEYLDPIGVVRRNDENELVERNCIVSNNIDEYNWGVAHQKFRYKNVGELVLHGASLANVQIRQPYHKYVNVKNGKFVSSCTGKGLLLASNQNGPSLICIGVRPPSQGVAYTEDKIPGRSGTQMGSALGVLVDIDNMGILNITEDPIVLWNMQKMKANKGFVQWKEVCGKKLVDVAPC